MVGVPRTEFAYLLNIGYYRGTKDRRRKTLEGLHVFVSCRSEPDLFWQNLARKKVYLQLSFIRYNVHVIFVWWATKSYKGMFLAIIAAKLRETT
ncbi:hypothetical protein GQ457_01G053010 [Hibiscus cannabinus]